MQLIAKLVLCILCVLITTSCSSAIASSKIAVRSANKSSVSIRLKISKDYRPILGTGTLVRTRSFLHIGKRSRYAILTAAHVADGILVSGYDAEACLVLEEERCFDLPAGYIGGVDDTSYSDDWALFSLKTKPRNLVAATLRWGFVSPGEDIYLVGYPWGQRFTSKGMLSHTALLKFETKPVYIVHAFAAPGNSGGGVFDKRGRLVGIVIAREIKPNFSGILTAQEDYVYVAPIQNVNW
jgi:hypothetical protein